MVVAVAVKIRMWQWIRREDSDDASAAAQM
jgi:hypothetical protein